MTTPVATRNGFRQDLTTDIDFSFAGVSLALNAPIIVVCHVYPTTPALPYDNKGSTYTLLRSVTVGSNTLSVYAALLAAGGTDVVVSAESGSNNYQTACCLAYNPADFDIADLLSAIGAGSTGSGTGPVDSVTPTDDPSHIIAACINNSSDVTWTAPATYTEAVNIDGASSYNALCAAYKDVTGLTAQTPTFTASGSVNWGAISIALKLGAGSPPVAEPLSIAHSRLRPRAFAPGLAR